MANFGVSPAQYRDTCSNDAKGGWAVRIRSHVPTGKSAMELLYLVLNQASKDWKMLPRERYMDHAQLSIFFEDLFTLA